ncbi:DUF4253 domain-containing protein [Streptomyces sp. NPDC048664]|uniref:DUF4253 domain-containing protein n=1 Tax=Streptomyces sp. NPDC048664 TaxID=3154505 RepID=UPI00341C74AA
MATLPNPLPGLASDPSGRALGLELPPGALIDTTDEGRWPEPLLWHAGRTASSGNWARLGARGVRVGLLPVLLDVGGPHGGPREWNLAPGSMSYPGDHDGAELLAEFWEGEADGEDIEDILEPYGADWPGAAAALKLEADPDSRAAEVVDGLLDSGSWFHDPRLALVPARRSADIPAAIGWTGPMNYESDTAVLCSVLRSWEDRFGIRVLALTFDRLVLSVAAPPATAAEAEAVAAEHFAFCPDNITQGYHDSLRAYAEEELLGRHVWSFWWD